MRKAPWDNGTQASESHNLNILKGICDVVVSDTR